MKNGVEEKRWQCNREGEQREKRTTTSTAAILHSSHIGYENENWYLNVADLSDLDVRGSSFCLFFLPNEENNNNITTHWRLETASWLFIHFEIQFYGSSRWAVIHCRLSLLTSLIPSHVHSFNCFYNVRHHSSLVCFCLKCICIEPKPKALCDLFQREIRTDFAVRTN